MLLGIDLGTTGLKVILVDEMLVTLGSASAALTVSRPAPLSSEQNPCDWWSALNQAMQELQKKFPKEMRAVTTIGLSGQQHGATVLDKKGQVLRPAILWNDGRSSVECEYLLHQVPGLENTIGSMVMPGFTAPKLLWIKKHEPSIFSQIDKVLLPKDYLRFQMSSDFATDLSDASGTAWLDVQKRCWSEKLLSACDLDMNNMPKLYEGNAITSQIKKDIADAWGLSSNVYIVGGAGDNAASAMSMGCVNHHTAYLSLGTSATIFVAIKKYQPMPAAAIHTFCHAVPNYWHHMSVHLNGASCLSWFSSIVNKNIPDLLPASEKNYQHHDLLFLPYLSGERTPHNNPHATGAFFGLTQSTNQSAMIQAVLEGAAFALRDGYDAILRAHNTDIKEIAVVGGGAKSAYWGKILASILNKPLTYRQSSAIGAAFGAAKLAWLAKTKNNYEQSYAQPAVEMMIEPDENAVAHYEKKYAAFRQLYWDTKRK